MPASLRPLAVPSAALAASLLVAYFAFAPSLLPAKAGVTQFVIVTVAAAGFALGYRRVAALGDTPAVRRVLLLGAVPLWALAVAVPPYDSIDLHSYTNIGWVQAQYAKNPYVTPVATVQGWHLDPLFNVWWSEYPCAYSFLFAREAEAVVRVAAPDKATVFLAFKLVNVVALALTVWVVWVGCGWLGSSRSMGAFLVAWNPLVLLHGLSNGHNDVLSGLGFVAALLLAATRLWWFTLTALTAAALIKYSTVPLFPLAALFLARRHGWVKLSLSGVPAVALAAWAAWPYLADGGAHKLAANLANVTSFVGSLGSLVYFPVRAVAPVGVEAATASALKFAGAALVLGVVAWLGVKRWRQPEYAWPEFVRDAVLVQFVLIAVASAKFYGWYVLMFFPAVAWLPEESKLRRASLALAFAQIGSLTAIARAHIVSPLLLIVAPLWWAMKRPAATPQLAAVELARAA
jgi:hypothetical protein